MIRLTCNTCKTVLVIDDAFAGGVCRCQHCGTIQTVPSRLKDSAAKETAAAGAEQGRTLYRKRARGVVGTGLEDLAEVVASSGLAGSAFANRTAAPTKPAPARKVPQAVLIGAGAVLLMVLGGAIVWLFTRPATPQTVPVPAPSAVTVQTGASGDDSPKAAAPKPLVPSPAPPKTSEVAALTPTPPAPAVATPPAKTEPAIMGLALKGPSVVYVVDRGQGSRETFDYAKLACLRSIESLGPETKFQLVFWQTGDKPVAYPPESLAYATPMNVEACRQAVDDVAAFGQSDVVPALAKALAQNPAEIVLITGKYGLDDEFVQKVLTLRKSQAPIHAFSVGASGSPEAMKAIAEKTGGVFKQISLGDLRNFAE